jgi:hypothetical protein
MPRLHLAPILAMALCAPAWAGCGDDDPGWMLRAEDAATGTQVYLHDRGAGQFPAFCAVARWPVRLHSLMAVLLDGERMPEWVYRARRVARLSTQGSSAGVTRVVTDMPWPLSDRDAVVAWRIVPRAGGAVEIVGEAAPERFPVDPKIVRMPSFASSWRLTPVGGGEVEVRFEGYGNPGGVLDSPILRAFVASAVWQAPLETMIGLRAMVDRPAYRQACAPVLELPCEPPR